MPTTYAIPNGRTVFDATIYTGNDASPRAITNQYGFQPDFVWVKNRSYDPVHTLWDAVRTVGSNKELSSATTTAEGSLGIYGTTAQYGYVSALNSNGFSSTFGSIGGSYVNASNSNYVAWQWQAGQGTTSSNTNGSITSTVSVNTTAGFSIVTYTGTGSVATIGHGLGVAPAFMVIKARNATQGWLVYHQSIGNTGFVYLNDTAAASYSINGWNNTSPTSTVFTTGVNGFTNQNGQTQVAYCWAQIAGFSQFGSYVGNNSTDNAFVYLGFRPKFLLIKDITNGGSNSYGWVMYDSSRTPYNSPTNVLWPNLANAENDGSISPTNGAAGNGQIDFLSNGFKVRSSASSMGGSDTYIYAAFAENPFKYANAR